MAAKGASAGRECGGWLCLCVHNRETEQQTRHWIHGTVRWRRLAAGDIEHGIEHNAEHNAEHNTEHNTAHGGGHTEWDGKGWDMSGWTMDAGRKSLRGFWQFPLRLLCTRCPCIGAEMELGRKVGQSELLADRRRWTCVSGDEKLFVRSRMKWAETGRGAE